MKNILPLLILFIVLLNNSCSCKKEVSDQVSLLPPETQTGANTFGCLINGKAFTHQGSLFGPPSLQCAYQYLNRGYYFQLSADDFSNSSDVTGVGIYTDSMRIKENCIYPLINNSIANAAYGLYTHLTIQNLYNKTAYSNSQYPGSLAITKYDSINQVVSGTFWFTVINGNGDTIKITNGRFDMQYTR